MALGQGIIMLFFVPWVMRTRGARKLLIILLGLIVPALVVPSTSKAEYAPFEKLTAIQIGGLPGIITSGVGVATVTSGNAISTLALQASAIHAQTVSISDPGVASISMVSLTAHIGSATLQSIPVEGPLTVKTMPVVGRARICLLLVGCASWVDIPLTENGTRGMGIGDTVTVNGFGQGMKLSVFGAPWTVKTLLLPGIPTSNAIIPRDDRATKPWKLVGFAHGPQSGTSTAEAGGVMQLVTAARIETEMGSTPVGAGVRIQFVPEPGRVMLLGAGVLGLALLARRKRKEI